MKRKTNILRKYMNKLHIKQFVSKICIQFSSVTQSRPTLCDLMNCTMWGLHVHYQLPESTQTHVHCVSDAIQPSHLLSSPSPPAFYLSQTRVFSNESALCISIGASASESVLPMNIQGWFPLGVKISPASFWISYLWNHTVCTLLCLSSFLDNIPQHHYF